MNALLGLRAAPRAPCRRGSSRRASWRPSRCADPLRQVVQRVAVLGEDDQLAPVPVRRRTSRRRPEQLGQLVPLAVRARCGAPRRPALRARRASAISASQLGDRPGGGRLVDDLLLGLLTLGVGRIVFEVLDVLGQSVTAGRSSRSRRDLGSALQQLLLAQAVLQALAAARAATGRSPRARRPGGAAGSSARSRRSPCCGRLVLARRVGRFISSRT